MQILGLYIARPVFMRTLCLGHDLAHVLVRIAFQQPLVKKKKLFNLQMQRLSGLSLARLD